MITISVFEMWLIIMMTISVFKLWLMMIFQYLKCDWWWWWLFQYLKCNSWWWWWWLFPSMVAIPLYLRHNISFREGSSGRFDVTVCPKQTMGKSVSICFMCTVVSVIFTCLHFIGWIYSLSVLFCPSPTKSRKRELVTSYVINQHARELISTWIT